MPTTTDRRDDKARFTLVSERQWLRVRDRQSGRLVGRRPIVGSGKAEVCLT